MQGPGHVAASVVASMRRSSIFEISVLLAECIQHGLRVLAFCRSRKVCELVASYARDILLETVPHLASRLAVYRCVAFSLV
jgi:DEAD/DEAH box helicase domain-containing protein